MMHTISRGLSDVEELERVKIEETAKVDILKSKMLLVHLFSNIGESLIFIVD